MIDDAPEDLRGQLELPEGREVITTAELARRALTGVGVTHIVGAEGAAPALVARRLLERGAQRLLCVAADTD